MVWMLVGGAILGTIGTVVLGFVVAFYYFPHYIIDIGFAVQRYQVGMKLKSVRVGKLTLWYGEKNCFREDKPTLVFLHGFTSSLHQWLVVFKHIKTGHHMIALDLPGHGKSSRPCMDEMSVEFFTNTVCDFLDTIGLRDKKVHVLGNSLGGALSGVYAATHPDRVEKVTIICPAMDTPIETEFIDELKQMVKMDPSDISHRHCRLLPEDLKGIRDMFYHCTYHKEKMNLHNQIYQGLLNKRLPKNDYFLKLLIFMNTEENLNLLARLAPSITMPSQIVWGQADEIISSSGVEVLKPLLPDCRRVDVLERSGHCIDLDRPFAFSKALLAFIEEDGKKEN